MLRVLKFLITGDWHLHKWEKFDLVNVKDYRTRERTGYMYVAKCVHCGKVKSFKVEP